ncbi:MAG: aminotransferase class I/II-fold pyridoxal phosphate-dependent enzyme, partial [Planctomycetota bacterium]
AEYMAWNFNSGMAAVDGVLSHLVGAGDIILASRNVYGGTYQLLVDWYGKKSNLDVAVRFFDGCSGDDLGRALDETAKIYADRIEQGRHIYVYLESPCNPHGAVLDVPAMCKLAHERNHVVMLDSTVGTPFLHKPLQREDRLERPDFVIHSYTKDLAGHGSTTAGVVIGPNERMFMPKGDSAPGRDANGSERTWNWDETMFWNVYYIKGAFLDSEKAFEVLNGMHTLELRMLQKCISTLTLVEWLSSHPDINVSSPAAPGNPGNETLQRVAFLGLPSPLFTFDFEGDKSNPHREPMFARDCFKRFFDRLDPAFGHQVSLGQPNTTLLCPAITTHSELSTDALRDAGIELTTMRVAVGTEDPRTLIVHLLQAAKATLEHDRPGFCDGFPGADEIDAIYRKHYLDVHRRYAEHLPTAVELMA